MSVDIETVKRVAHLARIAIQDDEADCMRSEINKMFKLAELLDEVDISNVEPLTSVMPTAARMREDDVTDGNKADDIVANAPLSEDNFFLVPKVVD